MLNRQRCVRCLIKDMCDNDKLRIINEYKEMVSKEAVCGENLYEKRLSVCIDCKYLNLGTCIKCGAYVEARGYDINNSCPIGLW